jgi:hypothetical protein
MKLSDLFCQVKSKEPVQDYPQGRLSVGGEWLEGNNLTNFYNY